MTNLNKVRDEYQGRVDVRRSIVDQYEKKGDLLATGRLLVFLGALALLGGAYWGGAISYLWLLVPLFIFAVLVVLHDRVLRKKEEASWAVEHYELGLGRIDEKWSGTGISRSDYVSDDHPYAADLDIFGSESLFELMCTARSASGEQQLAQWLAKPSTREAIVARQDAVRELKDRLDLREDIYLRTKQTRSLVHPDSLVKWATHESEIKPSLYRKLRILFSTMGVLSVGATGLCFFSDFGLVALVAIAIAIWVIGRILKQQIGHVIEGIDSPRRELKILADLISRIETEPVDSALLRKIKEDLHAGPVTASVGIAKLGSLVDWLEQGKNQLFAPIGFLLMWNGQFALTIERWRKNYGHLIPVWLEALGKFEAICSLSGYAYERPDDIFPSIEEGEPFIDGEQLGHPLLGRDVCVRNSVRLDGKCQLWVVSGSNMSGKSTFLRVIGINAILAMAGAPVSAKKMTMTPLAVGSTIRIFDSLKKGKSRFYAEISCLKDIMNLAESDFPLLFLLDEIFHGTNSHDRRIGAEAIVNQLIKLGAIGLVTTHDLALAQAASGLGDKAKNVHFEDSITDEGLNFDYKLKAGVVQKSNALVLMRSVGLNV